jgi:hypothetical protein
MGWRPDEYSWAVACFDDAGVAVEVEAWSARTWVRGPLLPRRRTRELMMETMRKREVNSRLVRSTVSAVFVLLSSPRV